MHVGSMYRSRHKEAKESFCDFFTIPLSFEFGSVMGKISNNMRHWHITNGGIAEDAYNDTLLLFEAKLILTNKSLHDFLKMLLVLPPVEMLCVNLQLVVELDYDRDVFHRYVD